MRKVILSASLLALAGCSVGITPNGQNPRESFHVPVSYEEAFRRAEASLRDCHSGSNPLMRAVYVNGNLFPDRQSGTVRVTVDGWSNDMARVDVNAKRAGSASVMITVWGGETWDRAEIAAIRESIQRGEIVCRQPQYDKPKAGNAY